MTSPMLSKNFSRAEFQDPTTGECQVSARLLDALEQLRALAGKPVVVTSGYRSPATNAGAEGSGKSEHMTGRAADFRIPGLSALETYRLCEKIPAFKDGGLGLYPPEPGGLNGPNGFVHGDVRGKRARWARIQGKYVGVDVAVAMFKKKETEEA
jgi:uncharacterized protein YcbK (DUF882 family)